MSELLESESAVNHQIFFFLITVCQYLYDRFPVNLLKVWAASDLDILYAKGDIEHGVNDLTRLTEVFQSLLMEASEADVISSSRLKKMKNGSDIDIF